MKAVTSCDYRSVTLLSVEGQPAFVHWHLCADEGDAITPDSIRIERVEFGSGEQRVKLTALSLDNELLETLQRDVLAELEAEAEEARDAADCVRAMDLAHGWRDAA